MHWMDFGNNVFIMNNELICSFPLVLLSMLLTKLMAEGERWIPGKEGSSHM
jgi:hypothetical protein